MKFGMKCKLLWMCLCVFMVLGLVSCAQAFEESAQGTYAEASAAASPKSSKEAKSKIKTTAENKTKAEKTKAEKNKAEENTAKEATKKETKIKETEAIKIETSKTENGSEQEVLPNLENESEKEPERTGTQRGEIQVATTIAETETAKESMPDTGLTVCIDPGHFKGASSLEGENLYGYEEGVFTLKIALALRSQLEQYGIRCYLTRETDTINIAGHVNRDLDRGNISLRGEMAKGADLFVSIHTNANKDQANGYPTCSQPVGINKPIILVNQTAAGSDQSLKVANEIGQALTKTSNQLGICETDQFQYADKEHLTPWSDQYNDSLHVPGTVCYRLGQHGDYYGVLRGAANVGVPGMIIEHGFHTVEEVRRQAMEEDLAEQWAKADAYGIAKGFGVIE